MELIGKISVPPSHPFFLFRLRLFAFHLCSPSTLAEIPDMIERHFYAYTSENLPQDEFQRRFALFQGQNLLAIGTDPTVRDDGAARDFGDPFCKGFKNLWVVAEISRLEEGDFGVGGGDLIGKPVNPVN